VKAWLDLRDDASVPFSYQLLQRGPLLAGGAYVLALIAADGTGGGWLIDVWLFNGAGTTD